MLAEETQASMRADLHQVLAYAATASTTKNVRATLIYPVRRELYEDLRRRNRAESRALIPVGAHEIALTIRALAFGER